MFAPGLVPRWRYLLMGDDVKGVQMKNSSISLYHNHKVALSDKYITGTSSARRETWQHFGMLDCLSCPYVVSADVLPWADLILGKGKWTGEIDGGVPSQTDNAWFCLQGVGLAHSSPAPQMRGWLCWGGEPFLLSMQIPGPHSEMIPGRLSQCGPEHSAPHDPCISPTWEKSTQAWGSFV